MVRNKENVNNRINRGGIMQLTKVAYATQFVSDQDEALNFYTKILDFEKRADNPTPEGPRFLTVGVKDRTFNLCSGRVDLGKVSP